MPTSSPSSSNNNISPLERKALQDLYDSTNGPHWNKWFAGNSWDFSNPIVSPCDVQWYGVTCSADYHVIQLNLYGSNLFGTISSTIGQLSNLRVLLLHHNLLIGTIPSLIGHLSSLQGLWLNNNQLTGTIPSTIGQLSSLQNLGRIHPIYYRPAIFSSASISE